MDNTDFTDFTAEHILRTVEISPIAGTEPAAGCAKAVGDGPWDAYRYDQAYYPNAYGDWLPDGRPVARFIGTYATEAQAVEAVRYAHWCEKGCPDPEAVTAG